MPVFEPQGTLGALEIGTFLSTFFFGFLTLQTYMYYQTFPKDRIMLKLSVAFIWLLELAHTILVADESYTTTITLYAQPQKLTRFNKLELSIVAGSLITCMVQILFAVRISKIANSLYFTILCIGLSLLCLASGLVVAVEGYKISNLAKFDPKWGWLITTNLVLEAVIDVLISALLCYYLKKHKPVFENTMKLVDQLVKWTIQTGVVTSATAIALVISFQTAVPNNFVWIALYTVLAKVYSNSLLASLNARQKLRNDSSDVMASVMIDFQNPSSTMAFSQSVNTDVPEASINPSQNAFPLQDVHKIEN